MKPFNFAWSLVAFLAVLFPALHSSCAQPSQITEAANAPGVSELAIWYDQSRLSQWSEQMVEEKICRISPTIKAGRGEELNHHRLIIDFTGSGTVEASIAYSNKDDVSAALANASLHQKLRKMASGKEARFTSSRKGDGFAWILLHTEGDVTITDVRYVVWKGVDTLYGHAPYTFDYQGGILRYRLMYPRNYDPKKKYPLVLSVSGSGGVGNDNRKNMEMVILGRFLFTQYYFDKEFECFSLVPQIPTSQDIPAPYYPKGEQGKPTPFHPDWPTVNENGWYVQATLALIDNLLESPRLSIDPDRIYYSGFSYGGKACWEFLKARREIFAAAACGAGWPVGRPYAELDDALKKHLSLEVKRYKHVPVYIFAGENCGMRFGSQAVHEEINRQGGKSIYYEVPKADHVQSLKGWTQRDNIRWLFEQKRSNNPPAGPDPSPKGEYPDR